MSKKLNIESSEVKRILSLHEQHKKKNITEQVATTPAPITRSKEELTKFFADAVKFGCLTDKSLDYTKFYRSNGETRGYVKGQSQSMPGKTKRVYDNFTYEIVDPATAQVLKQGNWACDQITKLASDAQAKNSSTESLKQAYIRQYTGDPYFYKTSLTDNEKVSGDFVQVKIKGTSTAEGGPFGDTGLIMYKNKSGKVPEGQPINDKFKRVNVTPPSKEECKKDITDIYNSYVNGYGIDRNGNLDPSQLNASQQETLNGEINRARACTSYYNNWGILGGGKQLDLYIDILRGDKPGKIKGREVYIKRDSIYNLN